MKKINKDVRDTSYKVRLSKEEKKRVDELINKLGLKSKIGLLLYAIEKGVI